MEKILRIQRQKGLPMAAMKMNTRIVSLMMMKIQSSCHLPLFIAVKVTFKNMVAMHNPVKRQIKKKFLNIFFGILTIMNSELRSIEQLPSLLSSNSFLFCMSCLWMLHAAVCWVLLACYIKSSTIWFCFELSCIGLLWVFTSFASVRTNHYISWS